MTYKAEIAFVRLLLPLIIGIVFDAQTGMPTVFYSALLLVLFFCALLILNLFYCSLKMHRRKGVTGLLTYLFTFFLGASAANFHGESDRPDHFSKQQYSYLRVIIDGEPQKKGDIIRMPAKVYMAYRKHYGQINGVAVIGRILIAIRIDPLNKSLFTYGDELLIPALFAPVESPYNISEFDVQFWLGTQNIYHQIFLQQRQVKKLAVDKGSCTISYALKLRQKQIAVYRKLIQNDEAFAVASTLVLGYRADLSAETLNAYSKTGTIHALSVSGMHVGLIYLILNRLLAFMDRRGALRFFKLFVLLLMIWFYSLITGFCPSVLRSAIMISVFILSKYIRKSTNSYNVVAFSAFCLLLYNPFFIWDVGFQLSFFSVFGLVYLQPKFYKQIYFRNKWLDKLWRLTSLSLSAQLITVPLVVYYFHQFPVYFLAGNLFIAIPVAILMYLGLAILGFRLYFLAPVFEWIINFTDNGLNWIAGLPFSTLSSIWISKMELLLLCAALLLLMTAFSRHDKKLFFIGIFSLTGFYLLLSFDKIGAQGQQKIIFFSLKKNYAAAFISAERAVVITDLSLGDKTFAFFIKPALDQHKITEIQITPWDSAYRTEELDINAHQITFHQYHILKYDRYFDHNRIKNNPRFDLIWLHDNPYFEPIEMNQMARFNQVVADASSKSYKLKDYINSLNLFHVSYHILKKNKGYLIDLTHHHKKHDTSPGFIHGEGQNRDDSD